MLTDRDYLARFEHRLPHPEAVSGARLKYMRDGARLMVRLVALDAVLTPREDQSPYVEALGLVQAFGLRCRASKAEIISAAQAEWHNATDYCGRFIEALRREVWFRCQAKQPKFAIEGIARVIAQRWDMPISDAELMRLLADIWDAANRRRRHRVRR